ncbi:MAG: hypothetical protein VYD91_05685 [Pseudomonadota bacterium]|nr:hypothetical protein [Pseudomonadota bacterium]
MTDILVEQIKLLPLPEDTEKNNRTWLAPLELTDNAKSLPAFIELVDQFMEESKGNRKEPHLSTLRRHWELVLLNLSCAVFQRRWQLYAKDGRTQKKLDAYATNDWKTRTLAHVVDHLEENGLIHVREGALYKGGALVTRIFPTDALAPQLYQFFLDTEQPIQPPYTVINNPSDGWLEATDGSKEANEEEIAELTKINEFLRGHTWACKGPVKLIYHTDFIHGGRLYTPFQNLPDRLARVRINTLIDGEPIAEIDFNANHLRLQLAVLHKQDAGDTPYEDIGAASGINDRDIIKAFITRAMGADNRDAAQNSCKTEGITNVMFEALEAACAELYPELQLFTGWTHQGQNLEGHILKKVMLKGIDEGVVCLPIHDAVAVPKRHQLWAVKTMISTWTDVVGCDVQSRVKVDKV